MDVVGKRFGRLTVIKSLEKNKLLCKCDCGNETEVLHSSLKTGNTQSCGCLRLERLKEKCTTHGMRKTRLYNIWRSMCKRCTRKEESNYYLYGGRGISVCDEWKHFEPFMEWALANGYNDSLTIDRIDSNGNYCPENCRWADKYKQANNKRNNCKITLNNETHTVAEWSRITNLPYNTIYRHRHGWSAEKIINTPIKRRKSNECRNKSISTG